MNEGLKDLKTRLDAYCYKHDIAKSQLIKTLLIRYLNQEEENNADGK